MFGHQDDNEPTEQSDQTTTTNDTPDRPTPPPTDQSTLGQPKLPSDSSSGPQTASGQGWQHPANLTDNTDDQKDDVISPAGGFPKAISNKETSIGPSSPASHPHIGSSDDNQLTEATDENLLEVKQKALDELFPLIDKLDQTSEEHFKTLMMIIQASDNHTLIEKAYQVAQTIDDEKARAQALLDIVNEINYFTQQPEI